MVEQRGMILLYANVGVAEAGERSRQVMNTMEAMGYNPASPVLRSIMGGELNIF